MTTINKSAADPTTPLLTRKQINYATERCRRIAAKKKSDLEEAARSERQPELSDFDRVQMLRRRDVEIDVSLLRLPSERDRHYYAPRVIDCADFSASNKAVEDHNAAISKRLKKAQAKVDRRAELIQDKFELGEPHDALRLLTEFEAEEFSL